MPRKNANARPPNRVLQAVPDQAVRTAAEDKLWSVLGTHPGSTVADLASRAGIGRSTAGKILTGWHRDGSVSRISASAHAGRRGADTWTIAGPDPAAAQPPAGVPQDVPTPDAATETGAGEEPSGVRDQDRVTAPEPLPESTDPGSGAAASAGEGLPRKGARLGKGALRGLVEDYLAEHPGEQLSPTAIAKALNRSSGAVANALDRLVTDGYALQIQDQPRRFTAKPSDPASDSS